MLYGYVKAFVDLGVRWRRAYWLHLIPFGLVVLGHIQLTVSPHTLSQVLNQMLGVSFNGNRVKAVKRALADPKQRQLTILALAFDAGFDSKAAFNNAFKNTPA